ncbi:sugar ABC transporter permease [Facklamia sp. DSM 111018]|uniref:Sugar ABC transporter permease n=1 Tax=Facklamia lactis TaxID=2749967 RepID=A0ABS0LQA3_9LACT|nr:sugar ABC transporter permease [Facklamia lactis]MBG9980381.1 sugar ABC transporter permease [Facklamia lactis]MBG9986184.1 sugar ABC transporter permease [Facklamia lactis]
MKNKIKPYLLILPSIIIFLLFSILPLIYMFYLSIHKGSIVKPAIEFIGFKNYQELFLDPSFIEAIQNTFYYAGIFVLSIVLISIPLSLWLSKNGSIYKITTSFIFSPHVTAIVSIALIFTWIMDTENGILNWFLQLIGLEPIGWLTDSKVALNSVIIVAVWKGIGYYTLIMMSSVTNLPQNIYEACSIDNIPKHKVLRRITLPLLSPTIFFIIIVALINSIQVFGTINIMTQGGPANSTTTLVYYLYEQTFKFSDIGGAAATGIILLLFLMILSILYFILFSKRVHYK